MKQRLVTLVLSVVLTATASAAAFAQGSAASSLSGTVTDTSGAVIPGASVVVKHNATGVTYNTVTNTAGEFSLPALNTGTYTVTISLEGFKTVVMNDVILEAGAADVDPRRDRCGLPRRDRDCRRAHHPSCRRSRRRSPRPSTSSQIEDPADIAQRARLRAAPARRSTRRAATATRTVLGLPQSAINITL